MSKELCELEKLVLPYQKELNRGYNLRLVNPESFGSDLQLYYRGSKKSYFEWGRFYPSCVKLTKTDGDPIVDIWMREAALYSGLYPLAISTRGLATCTGVGLKLENFSTGHRGLLLAHIPDSVTVSLEELIKALEAEDYIVNAAAVSGRDDTIGKAESVLGKERLVPDNRDATIGALLVRTDGVVFLRKNPRGHYRMTSIHQW